MTVHRSLIQSLLGLIKFLGIDEDEQLIFNLLRGFRCNLQALERFSELLRGELPQVFGKYSPKGAYLEIKSLLNPLDELFPLKDWNLNHQLDRAFLGFRTSESDYVYGCECMLTSLRDILKREVDAAIHLHRKRRELGERK